MKHIAALGFSGCQMLDLVGPLQVFASANQQLDRPAYRVGIIAERPGPLRTNSGMNLLADWTLDDNPPLDTLLVAGGSGIRQQLHNPILIDWLRGQASQVRRLGSVCTGAFLLAEAGLLDGKRVVTHWGSCQRLASDYPRLEVEMDALYIRQQNLYTSAGVTAGIDLALALLEEDRGPALAAAVARELVVFRHRPGGQAQFSAREELPGCVPGPLQRVIEHIHQSLEQPLALADLAEIASVSARHLARLFKQQLGRTPVEYIEQLRVERARELLAEHRLGLEVIAEQCGLASADSLRRLFLRRLGVTPSDYRKRFAKEVF
ncbi:GlxA family transcriptional regulator [Marinobacterium arenosum]|uniref:GlxA family transcriptional regulator n=1 Tax=Marinobacterium arenosum TaxID=2862496 RepID=UPI001C950C39|nr:GlxA family transcriptional regulator [Marinobacterium arenosum]MBY4677777.1 GlxA family transcriptional regulator [Marinobacterium arenosum]